MIGEIADFTNDIYHVVKNFTTAEGGTMVWKHIEGIDDETIYKQAQFLSLHGQSKNTLTKTFGYTSSATGITEGSALPMAGFFL